MNKLVFAFMVSSTLSVFAGTRLYVSPAGSSEGNGSQEAPYDLVTAIGKVKASQNDEIALLPGTYLLNEKQVLYDKVHLIGLGESRNDVIIDAQGNEGPFDVKSNSSICNVTLQNGKKSGNNPFAMWIWANSMLSNCVIRAFNDKAVSIGSNSLAVDCDFYDNVAPGAAAADITQGSSMIRCNVYNNMANAKGAYSAGVHGQGGGTLIDCVFSNNVSFGRGGAIDSQFNLVKNCRFIDNVSSNSGGAVFLSNCYKDFPTRFEDCLFSGNQAKLDGGAVFGAGQNQSSSYLNCVFTNNIAQTGRGGAINAYTTTTDNLWHLEVEGCTFVDNVSSNSGGAVVYGRRVNDGPDCVIRGCEFTKNSLTAPQGKGGALVIVGRGNVRVQSSSFTDCKAGSANGEGGAISRDNDVWNDASTLLTCQACTFTGNSASNGGAVSGKMFLADCGFFSNIATNLTALKNKGGAIFLRGDRFAGKETYCENFTNTISDCNFEGNVVYGASPAIFAEFGGLLLYRSTFTNNASHTFDKYGGWTVGIFNPTYFEVDSCEFVGNISNSGAGIYCRDRGDLRLEKNGLIRNSLFYKNRITSEKGSLAGCIHSLLPNVYVSNCTLADNIVEEGIFPGIVLGGEAPDSVVNCILYKNLGKIGNNDTTLSQAMLKNCFVSNGKYTENGCIGQGLEPGFTDYENGDLTLAKGSPCVDSGINEPWMQGARDLRNDPTIQRIENEVADLGCYELWRDLFKGFRLILR